MSEVMGYIERLACYPLKSAGAATFCGDHPDRLEVTETGFRYDREWMLVDEKNAMVTQRTQQTMARLAVDLTRTTMAITAPRLGELRVPLVYKPDRPDVPVTVHQKPCVGKDEGDEAANFFSQYLDMDVRLVRSSHEKPRAIEPAYCRASASNRIAFDDGFPFMLTSRASLEEQHKRTGFPAGTIPQERFRSNVRLAGAESVPYSEDGWWHLRIGPVAAFVVRACSRCGIPSVEQSGQRAGESGELNVLTGFLHDRRGVDLRDPKRSSGIFFGQNLNHIFIPGQTISEGDRVRLIAHGGAANMQLAA